VAQRGAGDRGRIDRVGLARDPIGPPGLAHHPGRHTNRALAPSDQVALQVPRDVTTVLNGKQALRVQVSSPSDQTLEP